MKAVPVLVVTNVNGMEADVVRMARDQRSRGIHRLTLDVRQAIREDHDRRNARRALEGLLNFGEYVAERSLTAIAVNVPENPQTVRLPGE